MAGEKPRRTRKDGKPDRRGAKPGEYGQDTHEPSPENRAVVESHAAIGTPHETIAYLLGISADTLTRHYRMELDHGQAKAAAVIGGVLFNMAKGLKQGADGQQREVDDHVQFRAAAFWSERRGGPGWRNRQAHDVAIGMGSGEVDAQATDQPIAPAKITIEFVRPGDVDPE